MNLLARSGSLNASVPRTLVIKAELTLFRYGLVAKVVEWMSRNRILSLRLLPVPAEKSGVTVL